MVCMAAALEDPPQSSSTPDLSAGMSSFPGGLAVVSERRGGSRADIQLPDVLPWPRALSGRLKTLAREYHTRPRQGQLKGHRSLRELENHLLGFPIHTTFSIWKILAPNLSILLVPQCPVPGRWDGFGNEVTACFWDDPTSHSSGWR